MSDARKRGDAQALAHLFDIAAAKERLAEAGGYEVLHSSPGLEIGVYVLVAAGADHRFVAYEHLVVLVLFEKAR